MSLNVKDLEEEWVKLSKLLAPKSIRALVTNRVTLERLKLDSRSRDLRLHGGEAVMREVDYHVQGVPKTSVIEKIIASQLKQQVGGLYPLRGGVARFNDNGQLQLDVVLGAFSIEDDKYQKEVGIDEIPFLATVNNISEDSKNPTMFESVKTVTARQGQQVGDAFRRGIIIPQFDMVLDVLVEALAYKKDSKLMGNYFYSVRTDLPLHLGGGTISASVKGDFYMTYSDIQS